MLDAHVPSPVTRARLRAGLAGDHIDAFAEWLHGRGYRPKTLVQRLCSLASWTDWMRAAGFTTRELLQGFTAC
jgi:hypothetical protein